MDQLLLGTLSDFHTDLSRRTVFQFMYWGKYACTFPVMAWP